METTVRHTPHTYFGFAEYDGKREIYDGNDSETCEGTKEEVIAFLQGLINEVDLGVDGLRWRGSNGTFYAGTAAVKALEAEIQDVRNHS